MNKLTDRESYDIQKVLEDKNYFPAMPERHKTAAVSLVAVFSSANNLEYVPDAVINKDTCRMAIEAKDADCSILSQIPYPEIQKKGIEKFTENTPAFVVYSFVDISDAQMAHDAVKADAYCVQHVPDKLITADLCKAALSHPDSDKKVFGFIPERFRNNPEVRKMAEEKFGNSPLQKEISLIEKKKGRGI